MPTYLQPPFFSPKNLIHEDSTIISPQDIFGSRNNIQNVFTDVRYVAPSTASLTIDIHWGGAEKTVGVVIVHAENTRDMIDEPTVEISLHNSITPSIGTQVATSGPFVVDHNYSADDRLAQSRIWGTEADLAGLPDHYYHIFKTEILDGGQPTGTYIPNNYSGIKSVRIAGSTLLTFDWQTGYVFPGELFSFSSGSALDTNEGSQTSVEGRPDIAAGGGVATPVRTNVMSSTVKFAKANRQDVVDLQSLYRRVGDSDPWAFFRAPHLTLQSDRLSEGGVVRFNSQRIQATNNPKRSDHDVEDKHVIGFSYSPWI